MNHVAIVVCLSVVVAMCWLGCLGMWRMKNHTAALHYLALPTGFGAIFLTIAVFLSERWTTATVKMLLITALLLAFNSIVAHATARAFRVRELGHWQPRPDERIEYPAANGGPR